MKCGPAGLSSVAIPEDKPAATTSGAIGSTILYQSVSVTTLIHETGHIADYRGGPGRKEASEGEGWRNALKLDTCTASSYAQFDNFEAFAEDMVVFVNNLWESKIPDFPSTDCMSGQLAAIASGALNAELTAMVQEYMEAVQSGTAERTSAGTFLGDIDGQGTLVDMELVEPDSPQQSDGAMQPILQIRRRSTMTWSKSRFNGLHIV